MDVMGPTRNEPFPMDYHEFMRLWHAWVAEQKQAHALLDSNHRFAGKNFMADEILGVYMVGDTRRIVEFSVGVFMGHRFVGLTFATDEGTTTPEDGTQETFAGLEATMREEA